MNQCWLDRLVLLFLWGALIEDSALVVIAWAAPDAWFHLFHHAEPASLDVPFLRRSAGQWLAFSVFQAVALWRLRKERVWLPIVAGLRLSDLFTDLSYLIAVPSLTTVGWVLLIPPPVLNLAGAWVLLSAYRRVGLDRAPKR